MERYNKVFKETIEDLIYSLGTTAKYLTEVKTEIKLNRITDRIDISNREIRNGAIVNLVGGQVSCIYERKFEQFLQTTMECEDAVTEFTDNFFDSFSRVSKHQVFDVSLTEKSTKIKYYIQFRVKVMSEVPFTTKIVFGVDDMVGIYFGELFDCFE